ncbi:MAG TPA: hypothetical protein VMS17_07145 [Gemmataceae bacterium]|nr:hypothetical protein [Gemmataceae bacterium]
MALCPSCEYPIADDRERVGARCTNCREPLYEPPERFGRPVREGEGACGVHPACESVGPCSRCGTFMCETCRTKWRDQILCAACVDRALESKESAPEQAQTNRRQAILALSMGIGAWVAFALSLVLVLVIVAASGGQADSPAAAIAGLLFVGAMLAAAVVALFGMGQAAAVLRSRGSHMILATIGLVLGALYIGVFIGVSVVLVLGVSHGVAA